MRARKFSLPLSALAVVVALVATASAARTTAVDDCDDNSPRLEGSWSGTATALIPPGLPQIRDLITFTRDGNVIESRSAFVPVTPLGPLLATAGHGEWVRTGWRDYDVKFVFLLQRPPASNGAFVGTDTIRMRLTLDMSGDTLTGTITSELRNANGAVVFTANGTYNATRIRVER